MEKTKITTKVEGIDVEFDVILTFHNENNGKDYIVYTDNSQDEFGKLRIYSSIYNPDTKEFLGNPETKEEWDTIYEVIDKTLLNN